MSAQPNAMPQCCLCGNWLQFGSKALYGYQVCPKCHTDFAWKRAFAYILDIVFVNVIVGVLIVMALVIGAIIMAGAQSANDDAAGTAGAMVFIFGYLGSLLVAYVLAMACGWATNGRKPRSFGSSTPTARPSFRSAGSKRKPAPVPLLSKPPNHPSQTLRYSWGCAILSRFLRKDGKLMGMPKFHSITVPEALAKLPGSKGERFIELFKHGTLSVELYAPRGKDPQKPHTRDEVYVVVTGKGDFVAAGERKKFQPGDMLFVAAHVEHRFENFSDDLAVWVFFYGPEGGER